MGSWTSSGTGVGISSGDAGGFCWEASSGAVVQSIVLQSFTSEVVTTAPESGSWRSVPLWPRLPVTAYEGHGTPGAATTSSAAAGAVPPVPGARRVTGPMRVAAGAVVLVMIIGLGWVALRPGEEVTLGEPTGVIDVTVSTVAGAPAAAPAVAPTAPAPTATTAAPAVAANAPPRVTALHQVLTVPTTTYAVVATDPEGHPLTYEWSMVSTGGPSHECGTPKVPWTATGQRVQWSHPDESFRPSVRFPCSHETTDHPVALTLVVTDRQGGRTTCELVGSESRRYDPRTACR